MISPRRDGRASRNLRDCGAALEIAAGWMLDAGCTLSHRCRYRGRQRRVAGQPDGQTASRLCRSVGVRERSRAPDEGESKTEGKRAAGWGGGGGGDGRVTIRAGRGRGWEREGRGSMKGCWRGRSHARTFERAYNEGTLRGYRWFGLAQRGEESATRRWCVRRRKRGQVGGEKG